MLLSASAFGANAPSPSSPAFPPSTFGPFSPPLSPSREVSPITPLGGHSQLPRPWVNTTAVPDPRSGPPTPISAMDSDLESPHGNSRKLYLPPRKDSMHYSRQIGHLGHAIPLECTSLPGTPARAQSIRSRSQDNASSIHSPRGTFSMPPRKPVAPRPTTAPAQKPMTAKLSLFPAPPRTSRPVLKQGRSHTESSLPRVSPEPSLENTEPTFRGLQRAHTVPIPESIGSSVVSPNGVSRTIPQPRPLIPIDPSIPTITIRAPAENPRRPSAVEFIASHHATTTKIKPAPGRAFQVQVVAGPAVEGQMAVKWVKKEEKQRRKMEKESQKALRLETAVAQPALVQQEITVWAAPSVVHSMDSLDSPTLGRSAIGLGLTADSPRVRSASALSKSPTINRPHPLKTMAAQRCRSAERARVQVSRAKHMRNSSDGTQTAASNERIASNTPDGSHRGRPRQRRSTMDSGTEVPPARGPLDFRKSTFIPFKPDLDTEALAALERLRRRDDVQKLAMQRENERQGGQLLVPRSKYLEYKPLPPPKPDPIYTQGKQPVHRVNGPLAKLASLIK